MDPDAPQRHDVSAAIEQSQPAAASGAPIVASGARITHRLASDALDDDDGPPTVERAAWLRDDDYWRKVTYMSATGRHAAARETRPLPRPDRFHKRSPLRSLVILTLVIGLIIFIPIGVVTAEHMASQFVLPSTIPGIGQPTEVPATHTPPVKPTATPRHKK